MPTNVIRTKGDIQTNQVISIEAADNNHPMSLAGMSIKVGILADITAMNSVVERKQGMSDKVSEDKSELFLDHTDFVVSDAKAQGRNHLFSQNFVVKPNKEEYRIIKNDTYMLEFDGSMTIRKALVKVEGFLRYPFQLQDLNGIEPSDNKYLIDVAGYVTNVGRTNHLKSGSRNLDFHLANHRQSISVTLWSG
ncbi:hypothetical protein Tco_0410127 [Tanacetum coccineum]